MSEEEIITSQIIEYKYQIWLIIDCNKSEKEHSLEITEMSRLLRMLPQTILNEQLPGSTDAITELENICNLKSFSQSLFTEIGDNVENKIGVHSSTVSCENQSNTITNSIKGKRNIIEKNYFV